MIIACPECTSPFELRDGDIAELVQLECPHCRFRMILDFAAANDQRLVEVGMKMASGYRSAAEYRAATAPRAPLHVAETIAPAAAANETAAGEAAARAEAARAAAAQAAQAEAARAAAAQAAQAQAAAAEAARVAAARSAQADAARATYMAEDAEWDAEEAAPTRVHQPPPTTPAATAPATTAAATVARPARTGDTAIGRAPTGPERPSEETTEPARRREDVVPRVDEGARRGRSTSVPAEVPTPRARGEERAARRAAEPVVLPESDLDLDTDRRKGGVLGALILVLLLVLAVGVTIASVIRKGTPDPRPLLEDLYKQYLQK